MATSEQFLDEAHALFHSSLDPQTILERLGWMVVPAMADWCIAHVLQPDGTIHALSYSHRDAARTQHARAMAARDPVQDSPNSDIYRVLHGGPAVLREDIPDAVPAGGARDPEHIAYLRRLGCRSVMVVPLVGRMGIIASLTFLSAESGRRYSHDDLQVAEDLARHAALAVENARLYDAERKARARAERVAAQTRRLQAVTSKLSRALPAEQVARIVLDEGASALGAGIAGIWIADDSGQMLHLLGSRNLSESTENLFGTIPLDAPVPLTDAVRSGIPVWLESRADYARRYPLSERRVRKVNPYEELKLACLPLSAEGRHLGGLMFAFEGAHGLDEEDRTFMLVLADHCAQALDRIRLLEQERRATATLAETNRTLDAIIQASPAAITLLDLDGTVRLWNPAAEHIFGWRASEVLGRFLPAVAEDKREEMQANLKRIARGEPIVAMETQRLTRDGGLVDVAVWAAPVPRPGGPPQCLGLIVDITDRKQAEEAARAADRRKDEFLAMLGHELRNPLAPIITALELMKLRGETSAERERKVIERQARHLIRLVDDLLDISRITRGRIELHTEPVALRPILAKAIEMASPLLEKRSHTLDVDFPPEGLALEGDPVRLAQVFQNLLTNAAKYTEPGGNIWLRAWREADEVLVSVRDNGIGMPPHQLDAIFEPFVQGEQASDRSDGGLGIGLSLVRSLLELHGGSVAARSEGLGQGSELMVRLPALPLPEAQEHGPRQQDPTSPSGLPVLPASNGVRVLLVDDNTDAAATMGEILRRVGYEVIVRHDGPTALETVTWFTPDIALLDIGLPVMDGYELARRLQERQGGQAPALVAITGYGQERDRQQSLEAGFQEHFVKPIDMKRLLRVIEEIGPGQRLPE